jgi:hypothetical protein
MPVSRPSSVSRRRPPDLLSVLRHITLRDRTLLSALEQHLVLTTDQIRRLYFWSLRRTQLRLQTLRQVDLVDQFRFANPHGGAQQCKWVLGLTGARFQAAAAGRPAPSDRAYREGVLRVSTAPTLNHLLTANEFFVRLHHTARQRPDARVDRWWSEPATAGAFSGVRPDGHALWTVGDRTVGVFLECDLGTENLTRLLTKLPGYGRLAAGGGPGYPVLFWLPNRQREENLHRLLAQAVPPVAVATAVHTDDPTAAVWRTPEAWYRVQLTDLPSHHGLDAAGNPNWHDGHLELNGVHPNDRT